MGTGKEDFSYWKYVRKCRRCKKKFGTDDIKRKQRCWVCTYGIKKQMRDKLKPKSQRNPDPLANLHKRTKTGWQWE